MRRLVRYSDRGLMYLGISSGKMARQAPQSARESIFVSSGEANARSGWADAAPADALRCDSPIPYTAYRLLSVHPVCCTCSMPVHGSLEATSNRNEHSLIRERKSIMMRKSPWAWISFGPHNVMWGSCITLAAKTAKNISHIHFPQVRGTYRAPWVGPAAGDRDGGNIDHSAGDVRKMDGRKKKLSSTSHIASSRHDLRSPCKHVKAPLQ